MNRKLERSEKDLDLANKHFEQSQGKRQYALERLFLINVLLEYRLMPNCFYDSGFIRA